MAADDTVGVFHATSHGKASLLNHAKKGVIKVYNQYRYDKEKQMALESWERKLNSIVTGAASGKVVSIQTGKKTAKQ